MIKNYSIQLNERESLPVFRVAPKERGPLLLVLPSIFGIGTDVVSYAHAFAEAGALVYALDSFWREDPGPLPIPEGASRAMKRMRKADPDNIIKDLFCALEAGTNDPLCNGSVILLGICFGGQFVVQAANQVTIQGLATWHGGNLLTVLKPSALEGVHVEMDFGDVDPLIPLSEVGKIQQIFQDHNNVRIRTHKNSGHGFTHINTVKFNPQAAQHAKQGVLNLIQTFRVT